jgi:hypothetical protein
MAVYDWLGTEEGKAMLGGFIRPKPAKALKASPAECGRG